PPPAPCPLGLAGLHRARARRAPDREEPLLVQRIDRDVMLARKGRDGVARPVGEWVELEQAARAVRLDEVDAAPLRRLVGAQAGDPAARPRKRARQRLDLAHVAAGDARL